MRWNNDQDHLKSQSLLKLPACFQHRLTLMENKSGIIGLTLNVLAAALVHFIIFCWTMLRSDYRHLLWDCLTIGRFNLIYFHPELHDVFSNILSWWPLHKVFSSTSQTLKSLQWPVCDENDVSCSLNQAFTVRTWWIQNLLVTSRKKNAFMEK